MNITEEQKQEADMIVEKLKQTYLGSTLHKSDLHFLAIQDRQSVLEVVKMSYNTCRSAYNEYWENEIKSLTNQIIYLKSKI